MEYFLLQQVQETCSMASIHLNVMELERYWQRCLEPPFSISGPCQERIIELVAILVDYAVNLCLNKSGRTNNHVVIKERALTFAGSLSGQLLIITIELLQVIRIRDITRVDIAFAVLHDDIDGKPVELEQFSLLRQQVKLLNILGRPAYAPAHQCVKLHATLLADFYQAGDIKCFHQRHHWHG